MYIQIYKHTFYPFKEALIAGYMMKFEHCLDELSLEDGIPFALFSLSSEFTGLI
jgi:hypothetical protein